MSKRKLYLGIILVYAALFRFYGLKWGLPFSLHIDEKNVLAVADKLYDNIRHNGSFNPQFSAYGALLFYLVLPLKLFLRPQNLLWGSRSIAAVMGLMTVFVTFKLGESFKSAGVGLLAALLTGLSVILFRESHFYTAETPLLFFVSLALYAGYNILLTREKKYYFWFAISMGLAASIKLIAVLLVIPLLAAHLGLRRGFSDRLKAIRHPSIWATLILAGAIFIGLNPYCVLEPASYWQKKTSADLLWNALMVKGAVLPPWTVQFLGRVKGVYDFYALYFWALGPPLAVAALFSLIRALGRSEEKYYYLLSWLLPYIILTASWQVKFIRYTVLVVPLLNILVADWLMGFSRSSGKIRTALILGIFAGTYFYAAAYLNVYNLPDSRLEASRYLNQQAGGKTVLTEVDEGFSLSELQGEKPHNFQEIQADLFYRELKITQRKSIIDSKLKKADFLVLSSNNSSRFARLPDRFPVLARFYQVLFKEPQLLGFEKIISFKNYPEFLGITVNDDPAELTFQLFDHPRITVFKKKKQ